MAGDLAGGASIVITKVPFSALISLILAVTSMAQETPTGVLLVQVGMASGTRAQVSPARPDLAARNRTLACPARSWQREWMVKTRRRVSDARYTAPPSKKTEKL
jgi:hypothetical protein